MNISDNIAALIREKGLSVRAFEQQIGCSNGVIARCISKGTDISSQWVSKIVETFPDVNPRWLLLGVPPMFDYDHDLDEKIPQQSPTEEFYIRDLNKKIDDKDRQIGDLRETLGILKERIAQLEREKNDSLESLQTARRKLSPSTLDL